MKIELTGRIIISATPIEVLLKSARSRRSELKIYWTLEGEKYMDPIVA